MRQISQVYRNDFGMAFFWKKEEKVLSEKVQLVFKETGFYFTVAELKTFVNLIEDSASQNQCCENCEAKYGCARFLLRTPCDQIDLAVSMKELNSIKDLVEGTLFKIKLGQYLQGVGRN